MGKASVFMERYYFFGFVILGTIVAGVFALLWLPALILFVIGLGATLLGVWDLVQTRHSILRNYPVIGHMRWLFEGIRPEIRQYLIESDEDETPFNREERSVVYERAKGMPDKTPFGTKLNVYQQNYAWLNHSMLPRHLEDHDFRVRIGGPDCKKPYDLSLYNISAMSFGALSANAIHALNEGAKRGGFAHDTGEGGISRYHKAGGGDLIYEIGSGYFGCRDENGKFSPESFQEQAALDQVKMIEIKISQGAKPGHGGVLPAAKITEEIAEARHVPMDEDCVSPAAHSAFSTPLELAQFIGELRELSGGKPVGFKLCIGRRHEFMAVVKAMLATGIVPDFIVVDGKEGGTGAAPLEFTDNMGTPLIDGLRFVHNTLVGAGLRDRIRIGASGKIITAFDILRTCAMGADWCNSARGFMFAIGCVQARSCHTNRCPTGVATQDPVRQRALVVEDKAARVARFHENTMRAVAEMVGAAGLSHPEELSLRHFRIRRQEGKILSGEEAVIQLPKNCLVNETCTDPEFAVPWQRSSAETFELRQLA